jgi:hypothetical protein
MKKKDDEVERRKKERGTLEDRACIFKFEVERAKERCRC